MKCTFHFYSRSRVYTIHVQFRECLLFFLLKIQSNIEFIKPNRDQRNVYFTYCQRFQVLYFWRLVRDTELTTITINILLSKIQNYKHFTHREIHRNDHLTFCQIPIGDPQTSRITLAAHIPFVFYFISACNPWNRTTINFTNQQMVIYNSNNCFSCIPIQITNICLNSIRLIPIESIHRHTALK